MRVCAIHIKLSPCFLITPPREGAEYCNERVCLAVCEHISRTTRPTFTKLSIHAACGRAESFSGGVTIRYDTLHLQFHFTVLYGSTK